MVRIAAILALLLGTAGLAVVVLVGTQPPPPAPAPQAALPPPPAKLRILVAARPVHAGTLLVPADIEAQEVLPTDMPLGALRDEGEARAGIRGAMVRRSLEKGDPVNGADLLKPGDRGFLAAVLRPGTRAVSVGVDLVAGTAGLIWPGDYVDVILTQTIDDQSAPLDHRVSGEAVLENALVIAIDQQIVHGTAPDGVLTNATINNRTVTLEVTERDAERVAVATRLGKLALAVRAADPGPKGDTPGAAPAPAAGVVWGGDVAAALREKPLSKTNAIVKLFPGTAQPVEYKY
ncbi:MAG TPA: Flp pilus assembly protein CpaB [Acetobacteraceae bacterium]|nr:Flp pilus assembly protein CpaB [Acetobacteraceae bacterium]